MNILLAKKIFLILWKHQNSFDENFQKNFLTGGEFLFFRKFSKKIFYYTERPGGI